MKMEFNKGESVLVTSLNHEMHVSIVCEKIIKKK